MLGQYHKLTTVGALLLAAAFMAAPVEAGLKTYPISQETETASIGLPDLYEKLRTLLGEKLYRDLLQNEEFIVFQELVMMHLETQHPVNAKR